MSREQRERNAWEAGFRLCRSYGDNHHHCDGEQKERETARAIARDALACWQGEDETQDGPGKRGRSAGSRATLRQRLAALSSPSTQEPNKETKMSSEPEIARCGLCGEPMPAGEEMFNYHGYSGPCPTPAPKPPQKATCETHGHIYGHEGVCLF